MAFSPSSPNPCLPSQRRAPTTRSMECSFIHAAANIYHLLRERAVFHLAKNSRQRDPLQPFHGSAGPSAYELLTRPHVDEPERSCRADGRQCSFHSTSKLPTLAWEVNFISV